VAALCIVGRSGDSVIVQEVFSIAAAVHAQLCGKENSSDEGEEDGEDISDKKRYTRNGVDERPSEADEENNPGQDGNEHAIVDLRRSPSIGIGDDVTKECCNQQGPQKRQGVEACLDEIHCSCCG